MKDKDKFVRDILKAGDRAPKAPSSEWSHIVRKIDEEKSFLSFVNYKLVSSAAALMFVVVIGLNVLPTGPEFSDQEISELITETTLYFEDNDSDDFYALE